MYFAAWLVLILTGLFLFGSLPGSICIGLAVGLHVGMTIQYGLLKNLDNYREKIAVVVLLLIGFFFVYGIIPDLIFPFLTINRSTLTIPSYNISEGDTLLARSNIDRGAVLARGSLVLIHPVFIGGHQVRAQSNPGTIIAEIVGLPGENIQVSENAFVINNKQLDVEQYPVPGWLQKSNFSGIIPNDSYFISAQYRLGGHGVMLTDSNIRQVCIVAKNNIEAKAFMRWLPLAKRGFLQ